MSELGYLYIISTNMYLKDNIHKIGFTRHLEKRLKIINSTRILDDKFFIEQVWKTKHYSMIEANLHKILKNYKVNNEFYKCEVVQIEEEIKKFVQTLPVEFFYQDAILILAEKHFLKWYSDKNIFEIKSNSNELILLNETDMLLKIKIWLSPFDRYDLQKFYSKTFWYFFLCLLKKNFIFLQNNDISEIAILELKFKHLSLKDQIDINCLNLNKLNF